LGADLDQRLAARLAIVDERAGHKNSRDFEGITQMFTPDALMTGPNGFCSYNEALLKATTDL
jgi:hypothetical protein